MAVIIMIAKHCEICGAEFTTNRPNQRTCSKACSDILCKRMWTTPDHDPFRPVTDTTLILVERYLRRDGYTTAQIAKELKRDVSVIDGIIDKLGR